jgi:hypothetical protein
MNSKRRHTKKNAFKFYDIFETSKEVKITEKRLKNAITENKKQHVYAIAVVPEKDVS